METTFTLAHILEPISGYRPTGQEPPLTDVVTDSREAGAGSLFVAMVGEHHDGTISLQAISVAPAPWSACVPDLLTTICAAKGLPGPERWESPADCGRYAVWRSGRCRLAEVCGAVIGITGSVGNLTKDDYAATRYCTFKSPGNRNSILGLPPALFSLRPEHERAVLEMGMYTTGEIARLAEITRPAVGVVTMIDPVHMSRAGSLENIVAAKQELVEGLPADGVAILNHDEPLVMGMQTHTAARVFTYGLDESADVWADEIESMGTNGIRFTLHHGRDRLRVQVPLLGRHSVHTALRATAVGLVEGLTWEEIVGGLQDEAMELRVVTATGPMGSLLLDDTYNASPASTLAALNLLEELPGRHIAVLGDMLELGAAEEESHQRVGRRARAVSDILVTVGEKARLIAYEAIIAGMPSSRVVWAATPDQAVAVLQDLIEEGDTVLIKGSRSVGLEAVVSALAQPSK